MDFLLFVYGYLALTAFLIFVLLFGDTPWAQGTPLSFCRWLISEAWVDALEFVVSRVCGLGGIRAMDSLTECCCERSNPALQIGYLIIWSTGYGLYWQHVFKLLPNLYAAEYHLYTGTFALCATLATFLLASGCGPGRVTQHNAAKYLAAYPPDGLLFPPKLCTTCSMPRPGRSKHCGVCGGCIPRFDHHCGWVNTCVGLHNMRAFLLFLAANLATCVYALGLMIVTMRGELHKRGFFDVYVYDPMTRQRAPLHQRPARFVEFLVVRYPVQLALGLFITVGGLLMAAFLAYQVYLVSVGVTTYEQFKRNAVYRELRELAAAQAAVAAAYGYDSPVQQQQQQPHIQAPQEHQQHVQQQHEQQPTQQSSGASPWLPWRRSQGGSSGGVAVVSKPLPPYDRGFRQNWMEVLFPEAFLQQQLQNSSIAAAGQQRGSSRGRHYQRGREGGRGGTAGQQGQPGVQAGARDAGERKQQ